MGFYSRQIIWVVYNCKKKIGTTGCRKMWLVCRQTKTKQIGVDCSIVLRSFFLFVSQNGDFNFFLSFFFWVKKKFRREELFKEEKKNCQKSKLEPKPKSWIHNISKKSYHLKPTSPNTKWPTLKDGIHIKCIWWKAYQLINCIE